LIAIIIDYVTVAVEMAGPCRSSTALDTGGG